MTEFEKAEKVVRDLEEELESRNGRANILHKKHEQTAYAARTGDKKARSDLTIAVF